MSGSDINAHNYRQPLVTPAIAGVDKVRINSPDGAKVNVGENINPGTNLDPIKTEFTKLDPTNISSNVLNSLAVGQAERNYNPLVGEDMFADNEPTTTNIVEDDPQVAIATVARRLDSETLKEEELEEDEDEATGLNNGSSYSEQAEYINEARAETRSMAQEQMSNINRL